MKILQKICFVLLLTTLSSVYGGSCFEKPGDFDDCLTKAKQGDARAQYRLGWIYRGNKDIPNDVAQDYAESVKWYRKAAVQGHASAQTWLGVMYSLGFGVNRDYKAAAKWYRKAADQGNVLGQLRIARLYSQGKGVIKNLKEAEKWYLRSASYDGDYTYAKKMIKEMYADNKEDWSSILHSIK